MQCTDNMKTSMFLLSFISFRNLHQSMAETLLGVIFYQKQEREELEKALAKEVIPRTNGMVKIDCKKYEKNI